MARVKLGFNRYAVSAKITVARWIVTSMTGNPDFSSIPATALADVTAAVDDLEAKVQAALKGGTDKTLAKYLAEKNLDTLMSGLADYVQVASGGNALIIESSGMEVQKERSRAVLLGAVIKASATVGGNDGEIMLNWDGMPGAKSYVVEMKLPLTAVPGPQIPNTTAGGGNTDVVTTGGSASPQWLRIDTVTVSRLLVKNLETGKVYSFRFAAINSAGQGAYSQTVSSVAK